MKIRSIDDIRKYYPDLLREYRDQVVREARERRAEERVRNTERVKRLFDLIDGGGGKVREAIDPIAAALTRLDELFSETRQIEDRLAGLDRLTDKVRRDLAGKQELLRQSQAGGIIDPPEELAGEVQALQVKLGEIDSERKALQKRKETIKDETVKGLRSALRPAWRKYVKARETEIDTALKAVPRVHKALESFFEAAKARREADGAFQRLLGKVEALAGGKAKMRVSDELRRESPEPLRPTDIPDVSFEDRRAWLAALELRRVFSSRVWTDPNYKK